VVAGLNAGIIGGTPSRTRGESTLHYEEPRVHDASGVRDLVRQGLAL
jgi:hypothetical protein